jgi:hypothetical protein
MVLGPHSIAPLLLLRLLRPLLPLLPLLLPSAERRPPPLLLYAAPTALLPVGCGCVQGGGTWCVLPCCWARGQAGRCNPRTHTRMQRPRWLPTNTTHAAGEAPEPRPASLRPHVLMRPQLQLLCRACTASPWARIYCWRACSAAACVLPCRCMLLQSGSACMRASFRSLPSCCCGAWRGACGRAPHGCCARTALQPHPGCCSLRPCVGQAPVPAPSCPCPWPPVAAARSTPPKTRVAAHTLTSLCARASSCQQQRQQPAPQPQCATRSPAPCAGHPLTANSCGDCAGCSNGDFDATLWRLLGRPGLRRPL